MAGPGRFLATVDVQTVGLDGPATSEPLLDSRLAAQAAGVTAQLAEGLGVRGELSARCSWDPASHCMLRLSSAALSTVH